ncbi:MAG: SGNH/GDSL hydrolase family protein [Myxococcota bacterium]
MFAASGCTDTVGTDSSSDGGTGGEATGGTDPGGADQTGLPPDGTSLPGGTQDGDDGDTTAGGAEEEGEESSTGEEEPRGLACLNDQFVHGESPGPDYTKLGVTVGEHCQGTDHQDITEIERVVFLGDSVTVGTPPAPVPGFYRSLVADQLAERFGLEAPQALWQQFDPFGGTSVIQESGDFASCAVWGARNDDIMGQMEDCFSVEDFDQRTLVIMTMGGNDVSSIAQDSIAGVPIADVFHDLEEMVQHHEDAINWLVEPDRFPNGVFVVNANVYEYTDFTVDVLSCPAASVAGFDANPKNPELLLGSLNLINEEYARVASETGTDLVFMFESFCGHGFKAGDPDNVCYRGEGNENWFDLTCIHPTAAGHEALAEMFINVVDE